MASSARQCTWCGGEVGDERDLRDHQAWCLGDGLANSRMLADVASSTGELTQEALVAAARERRPTAKPRSPSD
jgi:hypothetical protein